MDWSKKERSENDEKRRLMPWSPLGEPSTWPELRRLLRRIYPSSDYRGPHSLLQCRVNDYQSESKRVELFRLPADELQSKVRCRFAEVGADSWYGGIDDFGLYSFRDQRPSLSAIVKPTDEISISWKCEIASRLQKATNLMNPNWLNLAVTLGLSHYSEPVGNEETDYRLVKQ